MHLALDSDAHGVLSAFTQAECPLRHRQHPVRGSRQDPLVGRQSLRSRQWPTPCLMALRDDASDHCIADFAFENFLDGFDFAYRLLAVCTICTALWAIVTADTR